LGEQQMRIYRSGIRQNSRRTVGILANSTTAGKKPSAALLAGISSASSEKTTENRPSKGEIEDDQTENRDPS